MTSTLTIKDLALDKQLDSKTMSAVRGGIGNQANGAGQSNFLGLLAPVNVANGATFGNGPVIIQVDSSPTQTATNDSTNTNDKSFGFLEELRSF
jgi:hypothetical protein